jgi:hypothetical protein
MEITVLIFILLIGSIKVLCENYLNLKTYSFFFFKSMCVFKITATQ